MAARYWVGGTATWDGTAGTKWALTSGGAGGQAVPTAADTVFFDANSGTNTVTLGANANCLTLTMTGFTGTLAFSTYNISLAGSGVVFTQSTTMTVTGTPVINLTYSGAAATTVSITSVTEANAISFNITAGTYAFAHTNIAGVKNLDFTGFSGTWNNNSANIFGNLTLSTGMTVAAGTVNRNFAGTSGTQLITTNGKTLDFPVTFTGVGGTFKLADAMTVGSTRTTTLTTGTLDLNNKNLTTGIFSYSGANVRTLAFGTGQIYVTGSAATVLACGTATNLTITGTPIINLTYSGSTGTRNIFQGFTGLTGSPPSFNISAGSDIITTNITATNLDFTGFSGSFTVTSANLYGDLTISTGMTVNAGTNVITFVGTTSSQITTNGKTLDLPLTFNGVGGTFQFQDALTQGSTKAFTITNGTVKLKSGTTNTVGTFATSGTNLKSLQSSVAGSQATLSQASGTVSVSYLSIKDSNATGGAVWQAYTTNNNTDSGNNTGWDFGGVFVLTGDNNIRLRSFTERGRD